MVASHIAQCSRCPRGKGRSASVFFSPARVRAANGTRQRVLLFRPRFGFRCGGNSLYFRGKSLGRRGISRPNGILCGRLKITRGSRILKASESEGEVRVGVGGVCTAGEGPVWGQNNRAPGGEDTEENKKGLREWALPFHCILTLPSPNIPWAHTRFREAVEQISQHVSSPFMSPHESLSCPISCCLPHESLSCPISCCLSYLISTSKSHG